MSNLKLRLLKNYTDKFPAWKIQGEAAEAIESQQQTIDDQRARIEELEKRERQASESAQHVRLKLGGKKSDTHVCDHLIVIDSLVRRLNGENELLRKHRARLRDHICRGVCNFANPCGKCEQCESTEIVLLATEPTCSSCGSSDPSQHPRPEPTELKEHHRWIPISEPPEPGVYDVWTKRTDISGNVVGEGRIANAHYVRSRNQWFTSLGHLIVPSPTHYMHRPAGPEETEYMPPIREGDEAQTPERTLVTDPRTLDKRLPP